MKSFASRSFSISWALLLFAFTVASATSLAQSVNGFVHGKIQNFQQTSSAAPIINSAQPFQFGSLVSAGTATINSATLTFSGTASPHIYTAAGNGDFSIQDTFTTQAQLDGAYQNGNFTLSVNTSDGVFSRSVFLFSFSYPTTPRLTVPAGDWQNSVLVIDPALAYTFTWAAFSNAQAPDVINLALRNSGVTISPFPATQTSYTLPAGSLQPGTSYVSDLTFVRVAGATAADANIGAGYATLVKDTGFTIRTTVPALALSAAVSRKFHGSAGGFDVNLPLSGPLGIECRSGGATGDHMLVITFNNPVVSGNAAVTGGSGSVAGASVLSDKTMTLNLTGVGDAQTTTVTLSGVTDSFGQVLPDTTLSAGFLFGDTSGDTFVNGGDSILTRGRAGQALDATSFRFDVNLDGLVNSGDTFIVRARSGAALP